MGQELFLTDHKPPDNLLNSDPSATESLFSKQIHIPTDGGGATLPRNSQHSPLLGWGGRERGEHFYLF